MRVAELSGEDLAALEVDALKAAHRDVGVGPLCRVVQLFCERGLGVVVTV